MSDDDVIYRQEVISLDAGYATITFPAVMSAADVDDLEDALRLLLGRLPRMCVREEPSALASGGTVDAGGGDAN